MNKSFLTLGIVCTLALLASCESSEAIIGNRIIFEVPSTVTEATAATSYEYNITNARLAADGYGAAIKQDTLALIQGANTTFVGRVFHLSLSSPGVSLDSLDFHPGLPGKERLYSFPQERKYVMLSLGLTSPCLDGLSDGVYTVPSSGSSTKLLPISSKEEAEKMLFLVIPHLSFIYFDSNISLEGYSNQRFLSAADVITAGTVTIKHGTVAYDVDFDLTTMNGIKITGSYTGIIPIDDKPIWTNVMIY